MNQYIIMGDGNSSPNVIEDSLADLPKPRTFHLCVEKTKKEGISRVYDWLLDNKETFVAYNAGDAPKILLDSSSRVVNGEYPYIDMEEVALSGKIPVLYLYDDDEDKGEGNVTNHIMSMIDRGIRVLDLTQGLTPFLIVEEDADKVVNDTVDTLPPLTRKDYEAMPLATLKQHANAQGLGDKNLPSKSTIISALLGESEEEQVAEKVAASVIIILDKLDPQVFKVTEQQAKKLLSELK